jgi:preprotein translocase subunit Sss1
MTMFSVLAQPDYSMMPPPPDPNTVPGTPLLDAAFLGKLKSFQIPNQDEFIKFMADPEALGVIQAILLLAFGLVYLLQGWKMFKVLVVINATILGAFVGAYLGARLHGPNMPIFCGVAGGLLLGALSWPLMKFAISVMGGLMGSFLGFVLWKYVAEALKRPSLNEYAWAGALIGLILLGMLAFVIFRFTVEVLTSFQGSMMAVTGAVSILFRFEGTRVRFQQVLNEHTHLLPILIGVPAIIGVVIQHASGKGKKKPEGGGGK